MVCTNKRCIANCEIQTAPRVLIAEFRDEAFHASHDNSISFEKIAVAAACTLPYDSDRALFCKHAEDIKTEARLADTRVASHKDTSLPRVNKPLHCLKEFLVVVADVQPTTQIIRA